MKITSVNPRPTNGGHCDPLQFSPVAERLRKKFLGNCKLILYYYYVLDRTRIKVKSQDPE